MLESSAEAVLIADTSTMSQRGAAAARLAAGGVRRRSAGHARDHRRGRSPAVGSTRLRPPLLHVDEPELTGVRRLVKEGIDRTIAALVLLAALPAPAARAGARHPPDESRAGAVQAGPGRPAGPTLHDLEAADHAGRRRRTAGSSWRTSTRPAGCCSRSATTPGSPRRALAAPLVDRRAAPALERRPGRHVDRRAPPAAALRGGELLRPGPPSPAGQARADRSLAGQRAVDSCPGRRRCASTSTTSRTGRPRWMPPS